MTQRTQLSDNAWKMAQAYGQPTEFSTVEVDDTGYRYPNVDRKKLNARVKATSRKNRTKSAAAKRAEAPLRDAQVTMLGLAAQRDKHRPTTLGAVIVASQLPVESAISSLQELGKRGYVHVRVASLQAIRRLYQDIAVKHGYEPQAVKAAFQRELAAQENRERYSRENPNALRVATARVQATNMGIAALG